MSTIAELERRVDDEWRAHAGDYPNSPDAATFARHAEAMGLHAQLVCDSSTSTGAYYTVYAIYDTDNIFGAEPLCLILEDFSKSVDITWLFARHGES
jgi:hypothetical protein